MARHKKRRKITDFFYIVDPSKCDFDLLNDDTLFKVLDFVGHKSYVCMGLVNKRCNQIFKMHNLPKETSICGYAPLKEIIEDCDIYAEGVCQEKIDYDYNPKYEGNLDEVLRWTSKMAKGVVLYERNDVYAWARERFEETFSFAFAICYEAAKAGKLRILQEIIKVKPPKRGKDKDSPDECNKSEKRYKDEDEYYDSYDDYDDESDYEDEDDSEIDNFHRLRESSALWINALKNGHLNVLKWLRPDYSSFDYYESNLLASRGDIKILQWAEENGCEYESRHIEVSARDGHLATTKWLHEYGCEISDWAITLAAKNGHMEILEWMKEIGCDLNYGCSGAARGGQLDVLKWLKRNECEIDDLTCRSAAKEGHLEIIKWLAGVGCEFDYETCRYAAFGGQIKVLVWLLENNHITEGQYKKLSHEFEGGHLNFMMLSWKNGYVSDEGLHEYVEELGTLKNRKKRKRKILNWLRDNNLRKRDQLPSWVKPEEVQPTEQKSNFKRINGYDFWLGDY